MAVDDASRRGDGRGGLSYVNAANRSESQLMHGFTLVVTNDTRVVGADDAVEEIIGKKRPHGAFRMWRMLKSLQGCWIRDAPTTNGRARCKKTPPLA